MAGDYNGDGTVNAADYTVYRDNEGAMFDLPNRDPNLLGMTVGPGDYDFWRANFGNTVGSGAAAAVVPEPSGLALLLIVVVISLGWRPSVSDMATL